MLATRWSFKHIMWTFYVGMWDTLSIMVNAEDDINLISDNLQDYFSEKWF